MNGNKEIPFIYVVGGERVDIFIFCMFLYHIYLWC